MLKIKLIALLILSVSSEVLAVNDSSYYISNSVSGGTTIKSLFDNSANSLVPTVNSCSNTSPVQGLCTNRTVISKPLKCAKDRFVSGCYAYDSSYTVSVSCSASGKIWPKTLFCPAGVIVGSTGQLSAYCNHTLTTSGNCLCNNNSLYDSWLFNINSVKMCYRNGTAVPVSECDNACNSLVDNGTLGTPTIS